MAASKNQSGLQKRLKQLGLRGLPPLSPVPDLSQYKNDPYADSFLLNYNPPPHKEFFDSVIPGLTRKSKRIVRCPTSKLKILKPNRTNGPQIDLSLDPKAQPTTTLASVNNGEKTALVAPLEDACIARILQKIPARYDPKNLEMEELIKSVKEDFFRVLCDFTARLKEAVAIDSKAPQQSVFEQSAVEARAPFIRAANFSKNQKEVKKRLFLLDPAMRVLLSLCKNMLGSMVILNCHLYSSYGAQTCESLLEHVKDDCAKAEDKVLHSWFPQVIKIVSKPVTKKSQTKNNDAFYKCVTSVLSAQLKELVHRSVQTFVDVYNDQNGCNFPVLKLTLGLENSTVVAKPSVQDLEALISTIIQQVLTSLNQVPTIDSWLSDGAVTMTETKLPDTVLKYAHEAIVESIRKHFKGPQFLIDNYVKKYNAIIDGHAMEEITAFLKLEHKFEDYCQLIDYYHDLAFTIRDIPSIEYYPMFAVHCSDLKVVLVEAAYQHRNHVLEHVAQRNREENLRICKCLAHMKGRMKKVPDFTREMTDLIAYVKQVEIEDVPNVKFAVKDSYTRLIYLLNLYEFNDDDFTLNGFTLTIPGQLKPLIDNCKEVIEDCQLQFDESLQNRIEKLGVEIEKLQSRAKELELCGSIPLVVEFMQDVRSIDRRIVDLQKVIKEINEEEALFQFPLSNYAELDDVITNVNVFKTLFCLVVKWQKMETQWMDGNFLELDAEVVEQEINNFSLNFHKLQKLFRARQKQREGDGRRSVRWGADKEEGEAVSPPVKLCLATLDRIRQFKMHLPIVNTLCQPGIRPRHWRQMSALVGYQLIPEAGATLRLVLQYDLYPHLEKLETITVTAAKEYAMERAIQKMLHDWDHVNFTTVLYRDTGVNVLTAVDEVQLALDDHIVKIQMMRGSPFIQPFEEEVQAWEAKLVRTQETIDEWLKVQSQWMYLEPIFSSRDIVQQMPEEGRLFATVDKNWRATMKIVARDPKVMSTAGDEDTLGELRHNTALLEQINRGLNEYLEKKRLFFPRFFFLSNDEMLEILSETKDPLRVQPHLKKCFEGVARLDFESETMDILAMFSSEGERVTFTQRISPTEANGQVEKWLLSVQDVMLASVKDSIDRARQAYLTVPHTDWVVQWPGQVVLCVSQLFWTSEVHERLGKEGKTGLKSYLSKIDERMRNIVGLVRGQLDGQARITLNSFVVIEVHARDVVQSLLDSGVTSPSDFQWLSQLRYYWEDGDCLVRIINASVKYAYEYLGNTSRLVITPLTDRCYRTLVGAFHLHLNGAPEGPAGTGKTETVKDLAKALAVQCVVFNCSDGLDYLAMGKFFKGLASSGAWACFDEFNRIDLEVLSVVAQQILTIVQAVRANMETFVFEGTEIRLNPNCYTCITQNPGYAGRSELPDNLKALFRTVAMMVPDYVMIAEISLYSYGFIDARNLSVKIVTTYRLCSEQLSSQSHYDYGMRAVKTVLATAGAFKLRHPLEAEEVLILRSIMDVNLPKFLPHDIPLFEGIVSDLFPGLLLPSVDHRAFTAAALEVCALQLLTPVDIFLQKLIQVYETMMVRHGFMLVGETLGGKTCLLEVLARTLSLLHERGESGVPGKVQYRVINPKSITMGQLYGQFDPVSHEWTDGVVATIFRDFSTAVDKDYRWVVFDGPVDPVWIENMNAVLDDNKKLCLMSGEIIAMSPTMSVIFEVMDLLHASPATVSRCGMVYVEPKALGWRPIMESWIQKIVASEEVVWVGGHEDLIRALCEWLVEAALDFKNKNCKELMGVADGHLAMSFFAAVEGLLNDVCRKRRDTEVKYCRFWIIGACTFALVWSVGALCVVESRQRFNAFLRQHMAGKTPGRPIPTEVGKIDVVFPNEGLVYDYVYEYQQKGQWKHWNDFLWALESEMDACNNVWQLIVPTMDTVRCNYLIDLALRQRKPLLFVGPTGTGKSVYVKNKLLHNLPKDRFLPVFVSFSAQTGAGQVQDIVLSNLEKRRKGLFGPPIGKRCVVFLDDLHLPARETYGCQPPLELLRQFFDYGFWYDRKELTRMKLVDLTFLAAMGISNGSASPRFLRHFHVVGLNPFSAETLQRIFTTMLNQHLRLGYFTVDMFAVIGNIVPATMAIYKAAVARLLPTPQKFHYLFNLRDMARVILGCCLIRKESVQSKRTFTRLWAHEVLRVFYDRLVDDEDQHWLFGQLQDCVKTHFRDNFDVVFDQLGAKNRRVTEEDMRGLMFGDYLQPDTLPEERRYEEVTSTEQFSNVVALSVDDYNNTHKTRLSVVIFPYVLEHLSRLCRVLRIPGGHCLLVGVSGCGRQTLVRLAASMSGFNVFQPEITKNYGFGEWREDLKDMLRAVGTQGKPTVFLVTDFHVKHESFLEDIDSLLNSGEVPNIFSADEKQDIFQVIRSVAQPGAGEGLNSPLALFASFVARCRENLHLVVAFSPQSDAFRQRLRQFPSLINCCTIDWFQPWPADALECVAHHYLAPLELEQAGKGRQQSVVGACQHFHMQTRAMAKRFLEEGGCRVYVTPTTFLQLLDSFIALLTKKEGELKAAKKRYEVGLENLVFAATQIAEMQQELEQLQPQLVEAASKTRNMMTIVESESKEIEEKKCLLQEDEAVVNVQTLEAKSLRDECEADLAQAIPALELAIAALDILKPADITVLKSMKSPPLAVKLVMEAICVMLDVKPEKVADSKGAGGKILDYWAPSKKILGDFAFLSKLKDYDKDDIPLPVILRIQKDFLPNPEFKPNIVAKASSAAEGLCKWVCAMELYDRTAKIVAPKKAKLQEAEDRVAHLIATLNAKREELVHTENHLSGLHQQLNEMIKEKKRLESQADLCALKLKRAKELIDSLGDEKERWTCSSQMLTNVLNHLMGDVLLASGVIAYLGPFTAVYRNECLLNWSRYLEGQRIAYSDNFSIARALGDPLQIQIWTIAGLPNDAFSIDNAVIVHSTRKCPLMIDPQGQACKWIKATEEENHLTVIKPSDPEYQRIVEACVQNGRPLLIENVGEDLDPTLEPLLLKQTFKQGGVEMIRFGDKLLEYNPRFRLMMTTKLRNPHYLPEICIKVTLVNFLITIEGLEDQLLGLIVAKEKPELEEAYRDFVVQSSKNKFALKDIEDKILTTLTTSQGSILEDETAIRILDSSQLLADEIEAKQKIAEETENLIVESRMNYRPVAKHSAILFFCLTELPNVDPMYQYSLAWFVHLFHASITNSEKSDVLNERLEHLMNHFTYSVYVNVCRSLFEKDKLLFSFVLCCNLLLAKEELDKTELMFFLTGGVGLKVKLANPDPSWISDQSWQELCRLSDLPSFSTLLDDFVQALPDWHRYFQSCSPHTDALPLPYDQTLSDFQKMCILRCLRSDKVIPAVSNFVSEHLGTQFVQPPTFNLAQSYDDSSAVSPLLFVLSPGIDPLSSLQRFATQNGLSECRLHIISLGQGQGPFAQRLIEAAKKSGDWVMLQNCHLAVSWLSTLEIICEGLRPDNTHPNFRLWLTSYPSEKFPVSILQSSVKMTNEPPTGLRQCLLRVYKDEPIKNPEFFNSCSGKQKTFRKLLFGLCFFHALVSERRKFGSMGWNISYGFNDSDLAISLQQLQLFVNEYLRVPFDALNYMIGECNYGGRVTDDWDRRTLITILGGVCNESILKTGDYMLPGSGNFALPEKETYEEYLQFIKNLPIEQDPEVFGLHRNVDISRNLQESRFLWDSVLRTQGQGLMGRTTDLTDKSFCCIIEDILKKLPDNFSLEAVSKKYPLCYGDSMNTVLVQEMERYNRLLTTIRDSLKSLEKAVEGLVLMSGDLELVASALLIGKIPVLWAEQSYPSLKPLGSYVSDLLERLQFLEEWYQHGKPAVYWLPGFYFTQAFLTAVLQNHARKYTIPIDKLVFDFKVMPFNNCREAPADGVYVNGMFLEGARWDRVKEHLAEQLPGKLWDPVPIVWLLPALKDDLKQNERYPCPLYKTRERKGSLSTTGHSTNYVLTVLLNSDRPLQHWIKRGTALVCQLDS